MITGQSKLNVQPRTNFSQYRESVHENVLYSNPAKKIDIFFNQYKPLQYKKRSIVFHAEDTLNSVFCIKSGYMRVYKISEQGEELTLIILKPNDLFPLTSGVTNLPGNYYLEALTPLDVWRVPEEHFYKFIATQPDVYNELASRVLVKIGGLLTRMEYMVFGTAYTKVASILLICAKQFGEKKGNDIVINLPLTHKDIATLVGITRETACLEMRKLEKKGLVAHLGRLVIVKNISRLEEESLFNEQDDKFLNHSF